jgi:c-di-GMP-binding flagellar brake protein YcgR
MAVQLQLNQAIWIQVVGDSDNAGANCLVAAISPDRVTLRFADARVPPLGLAPGCSVLVRLVNEQGVHTGVASVVQVARKPHLAATLRAPLKFSTTQKRRFVRVAVKLPAICTVRVSKNETLVGQADAAAKTHDLSAGGMRVSTALPLRAGDELTITVKARNPRSGPTELNLYGRVVRVEPGDKKPRTTLVVGIELVHAHQRAQDALVLFVFELQRKSLA